MPQELSEFNMAKVVTHEDIFTQKVNLNTYFAF